MNIRSKLRYPLIATLALSAVTSLSAAQAWRGITMPTVAEVAAAFPEPPMEYRAIHWAIWGGPQTKERIIADIEHAYANGVGVYMIDNSQRVQPKYLSPEYMDLVKTVVQECKKRGMKVWIEGDCGYPDGFAGGAISRDYPLLGMQAILADAHCTVPAGQSVDLPLPADTLGILAYQHPETPAPAADAAAPTVKEFPLPADGTFKYTPPRGGAGEITVQLPNGDVRYSVTVGEPFSIPVPTGTKRIFLTAAAPFTGQRGRGGRGAGGPPEGTVVPLPADGHLKWTAPAGTAPWEIAFIRHAYRTSPTRNDNGDDGGATKDTLFTLIDYLDPVATDTYLKTIYGAYEQAVGEEFGKTIMGFRADETDFTGVSPWTPRLLETFQAIKGYDFKPFIPLIFGGHLTPEALRAKADYADVWSRMFRDNFYKHMGDWCSSRNMEFMIHLNHEETMMALVGSEGSFWRDMRYTGVPGIDNLAQIGPGIIADFPKLAASAAHINGRALAWEESGGGPNQTGKFTTDYHLVRGVNYLNIRGLNGAPPAPGTTLLDLPSTTGHYVSRAQYLLAVGRPAAQVALLHPTDSMWYGDREADSDTVSIVTQLLEHQIDFDHIDAETLANDCSLANGALRNLSGQLYRGVIVPTSTVIQKDVLVRLREFARGGGKVVFVGRTPTMVVDRNFLQVADGAPDLGFATLEPTPRITSRVVAALPPPDVKLDADEPPIKYNHRSYKDGEVYFFFNESKQRLTCTATILGQGRVQVWDATSATIHLLAGVAPATGRVAVPLDLGPQESRFIVIGALPAAAGDPVPTVATSESVASLDGDWSVTLGDQQVTGALKPWDELGAKTFSGTAVYKREFTPAAVPQGKHVYLDLGDAHEIASVRLNGHEFAAKPWPPYLWDVTSALTKGTNLLEVQVQPAPAQAGRGRPMGAPGGPAGAPPGGGFGGPPPAPSSTPTAGSGLLGPVRIVAQ